MNVLLRIKPTHSRSLNITKNVIVSFFLKGMSIGISLLMVPMTLNYLDKERYGLWLTISSIIGWFSLFDIGLGNGFRNKFAEALAKKNINLAKTYVSTTFALLVIIITLVLIVFVLANLFLDWTIILNTNIESKNILSLLVFIVFFFFSLQFIFKLVTSILLADQKPMLVDLIGVIGNLLSFIGIFGLILAGVHSMVLFSLTLSACPVFVLIIAIFFFFSGKYHQYKPSIKHIDFKQSKNLMGLGFMFFIPQVCALVLFSTSNVIIIQLFSPVEVTVYNIAFKYFSVVTLFWGIIITPLWSAFTEAFVKKDTLWIKNITLKLIFFWSIFFVGTVVMVILSELIYHLWVGKDINIPINLTIGLAIYVSIYNWNNLFVAFNAGVSKMVLQVILALIGVILFFHLFFLYSII